MATPDELRVYFELADQLIAGASKEGRHHGSGPAPSPERAHYQLKFGALPFEDFADMLRAESIDPETTELLSTGMQQLVSVLGIAMGLDEDHGATGVH